MTEKKWVRLLEFATELAYASIKESSLPYRVFGGTQCGRVRHTSNQDSSAIAIGDDLICMVVTDGCSTGAELPGLASCNGFGATLLARRAGMFFVEKRPSLAKGFECLRDELEEQLVADLAGASTILGGFDSDPEILYAYLMSTVLLAVVTSTEFVVLGCGDGIYTINGDCKYLHEEDGRYLATQLDLRDTRSMATRGHLRLHEHGEAHTLESLVIGTDGFGEFLKWHQAIARPFFDPAQSPKALPGYDPSGIYEFNERVWRTKSIQDWVDDRDAVDDATFVALVRTGLIDVEETTVKETLPLRTKRKTRRTSPIGSDPGKGHSYSDGASKGNDS